MVAKDPDRYRNLMDALTSTRKNMTQIVTKSSTVTLLYINLFSDSQAALKALDSCVDNSNTIMEFRRSLNELAKHHKITLNWLSGRQQIQADCIADELESDNHRNLSRKAHDWYAHIYLQTVQKQKTLRQAELRWKNATNCEICKQTWPSYNLKRTKM